MARQAPAARAALDQATERWPDRSKASDGICGDAAHAARRSDHNPGAAGYCHAWDLTHDPKHGVDTYKIADDLRRACQRGTEKRVKLIISNSRIASPVQSWRWRPYNGSSPHTQHMHVSLWDTKAACTDTSDWPGLTPDAVNMLCIKTHGARSKPRWGWASPIVGKFEKGKVYSHPRGKFGNWLKFNLNDDKQAWGYGPHFK